MPDTEVCDWSHTSGNRGIGIERPGCEAECGSGPSQQPTARTSRSAPAPRDVPWMLSPKRGSPQALWLDLRFLPMTYVTDERAETHELWLGQMCSLGSCGATLPCGSNACWQNSRLWTGARRAILRFGPAGPRSCNLSCNCLPRTPRTNTRELNYPASENAASRCPSHAGGKATAWGRLG